MEHGRWGYCGNHLHSSVRRSSLSGPSGNLMCTEVDKRMLAIDVTRDWSLERFKDKVAKVLETIKDEVSRMLGYVGT